jgi:hypothetical protein
MRQCGKGAYLSKLTKNSMIPGTPILCHTAHDEICKNQELNFVRQINRTILHTRNHQIESND